MYEKIISFNYFISELKVKLDIEKTISENNYSATHFYKKLLCKLLSSHDY